MLKTAMIFTDKMVLQREKDIPVWGWAAPGEVIKVVFDGQEKETVADEAGNWQVKLAPHAAGTGYTMCIIGEQEKLELTDICVGEVWLAGGQSNMEFLLGYEQHFDEVLAGKKNPVIRFLDYPEVSYEGQMEDYDYKNEGFWRGCTEEDLPFFSAVGYYFAENLQQTLQVPIGIVGCNWGGTPASAWMDPERLKGTEGEVWIQDFAEQTKDVDVETYKRDYKKDPANDRTNMLLDPEHIALVKYEMSRESQLELMKLWEQNPPQIIGPYYERRPGGLYETMLKKIWPFAVRGVIWYQGETDGDFHPHEYTSVFSSMIQNWRDLWQEELPFLFVQLAPFYRWLTCEGTNYPIVRFCQDEISRTVPKTWMATSGDVGMKWDIHPKNKLPLGNRLARLARGYVYGEELLCEAPEVEKVEKQGDEIHVTFQYGDGLRIAGQELHALTGTDQAGNRRELVHAETKENVLYIKDCADIVSLEFATGEYYEVNLYNAAEIPAKPWKYTL